jgi:hypothetical protein
MSNSLGTSSQQQSQSSQTAPWAPAQPALQSILGGIQGQIPNYNTNPTEQAALGQLTSNAQGINNFAPQAQGLTSQYLGGDPTGLLNPALQQYQQQVNPIANASLDPTQTPGIQNALNTINTDVSNQVNGQFAGAGRSLSGLNQQTLARGISQGDSAALLGQYNQNVANTQNAAGGLLGASGNVASALTGNQAQGLNFAGLLPQLAQQGPASILQAQQAGTNLPLNNLGSLENLTVPIAGLGGQSSGQAYGTATASPLQQIVGLSQAFGNAFGGQKPAVGNALGFLGV